jgi:hypothetical protein
MTRLLVTTVMPTPIRMLFAAICLVMIGTPAAGLN